MEHNDHFVGTLISYLRFSKLLLKFFVIYATLFTDSVFFYGGRLK